MNPLTGDHDIVIQLPLSTVNDGLAAAHSAGEFLADVQARLNAADHGANAEIAAQLSTPELSLSGSGTAATLATMARRFGEAPSSLPSTAHGRIDIAAGIDRLGGSESAVVFDPTAAGVSVTFTADPGDPLSGAELGAVRNVISRVVTRMFYPVTFMLPALAGSGGLSIADWNLGSLGGALGLGLRLDAGGTGTDLGSNRLGATDGLVAALSFEFLELMAKDEISRIGSFRVRIGFAIFGATITLATVTVRVDADSVTVSERGGNIELSVEADVGRRRIRARMQLRLVVSGGVLRVAPAGDVRVDVLRGSAIDRVVASLFGNRLNEARDGIVAQVNARLGTLSGASGLLTDLGDDFPIPSPSIVLTSADVDRSGIVARARVSFPTLPPPVARLRYSRKIDMEANEVITLDGFESWIPGGTIDEYRFFEVIRGVRQPPIIERHRFFTEIRRPWRPSPDPFAESRWCVEVVGTQGRNSDGSPRRVSAEWCPLFGSPPILVDWGVTGYLPVTVFEGGRAVAAVDAFGATRGTTAGAGYLLVAKGNGSAAETAAEVVAGVTSRKNPQAAVYIVAIGDGPPDGKLADSAADPLISVLYTDDALGTWTAGAGLESGGAVMLSPEGKEVLRTTAVSAKELAAQIAGLDLEAGHLRWSQLAARVAPGMKAPDFRLRLQKTSVALHHFREEVAVCFFAPWSPASVDELRRLTQDSRPGRVLAVATGERRRDAEEFLADHQLEALLVPDPDGSLSSAYGITCWPTTVTVDSDQIVRSVTFGAAANGKQKPEGMIG